jgi:hypothetical protein
LVFPDMPREKPLAEDPNIRLRRSAMPSRFWRPLFFPSPLGRRGLSRSRLGTSSAR